MADAYYISSGVSGAAIAPSMASGLRGYRGWSMVTAIVADGERRVRQVADWIGGEGPKPPVGQYVGASGLVDSIEAALSEATPLLARTWAEGTMPGGPDTKSAREWAIQSLGAAASAAGAAALSGSYDTKAQALTHLADYSEGQSIQITADGPNTGVWVKRAGVLVKLSDATLPAIRIDLDARIRRSDVPAEPTAAVAAADNRVVATVGDGGLKLPGLAVIATDDDFHRWRTKRGHTMMRLGPDGLEVGALKVDGRKVTGEAEITSRVASLISGAQTTTSFTVNVRLDGSPAATVGIVAADNAELTDPVYVSPAMTPVLTPKNEAATAFWRRATFTVTGLRPDTRWYYRIVVDGRLGETLYSARTLPVSGKFGHFIGSCLEQLQGPDSAPAFAAMKASSYYATALFLVNLGDFNYRDDSVDDILTFRTSDTIYLASSVVAAFHAQMAGLGLYSDHDYVGGNDATMETAIPGSTFAAAGETRRIAFREAYPMMPSPQIIAGEKTMRKVLGTQAWPVADVAFYLADLQAQATLTAPRTCFGTGTNPPGSWNQRQDLFDAFDRAVLEGRSRFVFLSTRAWNGPSWATFAAERTLICDRIKELEIPVLIECGDPHLCGADDGTNTDFSSDGSLALASLTFSPFLRDSKNTGTYSWRGAPSKHLTSQSFGYVEYEAGEWMAKIYGEPFTGTTPTLYGTYSSLDDTPKIGFASGAVSAPAGSPVTIRVNRTWFGRSGGRATADWATTNGQSGVASVKPNKKWGEIVVVAPGAGQTVPIALSNPIRAQLGAITLCNLTGV